MNIEFQWVVADDVDDYAVKVYEPMPGRGDVYAFRMKLQYRTKELIVGKLFEWSHWKNIPMNFEGGEQRYDPNN